MAIRASPHCLFGAQAVSKTNQSSVTHCRVAAGRQRLKRVQLTKDSSAVPDRWSSAVRGRAGR